MKESIKTTESHELDILNVISDKNLKNILEFVLEIGNLKSVLRQTFMPHQNRYENSAEHTWHLTIMAILLQDYATSKIDIGKTIKLLVVHDLAETWIGDTFLYNQTKDIHSQELEILKTKTQNLSKNIQNEILSLWIEFEEGKTEESKFGKALDRFDPFLYQLQNGGESWEKNKISHEKALARNTHINDGSTALWDTYKILAEQAKSKNLFYQEEINQNA